MYPKSLIILVIKAPTLFPASFSPGYSQMDLLGKKFCILYALCEQQLSKQRQDGRLSETIQTQSRKMPKPKPYLYSLTKRTCNGD